MKLQNMKEPTIQEFYNEIRKLHYWSMVENYEYNHFEKILEKYNLKKICQHCGMEIEEENSQ